MNAIFRNSLNKSRGAILGWGIGLGLLGAMFVPIYDTFKEQAELMTQMMDIYPPELMAFFGDFSSITTPDGFLSIEYFSIIPLVLAIYAIGAGSRLVVGDEENGTLDLIAAHPISRSNLFYGRLAAFISAVGLILVLAYLGIYIPAQITNMGLTAAELLTPFLSMFAYLLLFGTLSLILSLVLPSKRMASMAAGIIMVADFFIQGFASSYSELESVAAVLPLKFLQRSGWIDGLELGSFFGLIGVATMFSFVAWWRFLRRDIRVGGEGSWELPSFVFRSSKKRALTEHAKVSGD